LITPNIEEAKVLTDTQGIKSVEDMKNCCILLHRLGAKISS